MARVGSTQLDNYFVCIGAQKSGTSWLANALSFHRDIFISPIKEVHYFDWHAGVSEHLAYPRRRSRLRKYFQRLATQPTRFGRYRRQFGWYRRYMRPRLDDAWYLRLFEDRLGATFAGEATPEYALLGTEGFAHIRALAPEARVIYLMRDPVKRAWSQLLHQCRRDRVDVSQMPVSEMQRRVSLPTFDRFGRYVETIDAANAVFGPERVGLFFYEDMHADRWQALLDVSRFIGAGFHEADFAPLDLDARVNVARNASSLPADFAVYLARKYAAQVDGVEARAGRVPVSWRAANA
ncbi:MAG: sulfotransferase [Pseudomonadota bacterium]